MLNVNRDVNVLTGTVSNVQRPTWRPIQVNRVCSFAFSFSRSHSPSRGFLVFSFAVCSIAADLRLRVCVGVSAWGCLACGCMHGCLVYCSCRRRHTIPQTSRLCSGFGSAASSFSFRPCSFVARPIPSPHVLTCRVWNCQLRWFGGWVSCGTGWVGRTALVRWKEGLKH